jgi:hypothetical protein
VDLEGKSSGTEELTPSSSWSFPTVFIGNPSTLFFDGSPLTTGGDNKKERT